MPAGWSSTRKTAAAGARGPQLCPESMEGATIPTRYLICGGRDFADEALLDKALKALILHPEDAVIIHGAARGADRMAAAWGKDRGAQIEPYPITSEDWTRLGKAAGPIRNRQMLDIGKPDVVLAFPGGPGTANMVKQARARPELVVVVITGQGGDWYAQATQGDLGLGLRRTTPE